MKRLQEKRSDGRGERRQPVNFFSIEIFYIEILLKMLNKQSEAARALTRTDGWREKEKEAGGRDCWLIS